MNIKIHLEYKGSSKILKRICQTINYLSENASGDMLKATYDTNDSGVVDNAEKVNGHSVYKDVPSDAVFTDTVYDDTEIKGDIGDLDNLQTSDKTSLVAAVNVAHSEAVAAAKTATDLGLSVKDGMLQVTYE